MKTVWLFCCLAVLSGCASYSSRIAEPRRFFEAGQYDPAIARLTEYADKHDNDELLYVMDLALVLHTAGRYQEAIDTFLRADKLAEIKDYTSITQEAASIMLSDDVKPYKGEDFEKILINVYLAIDYTMLHNWSDALVECRRVNHKLDLMISQGGMPYEQNGFAKYLSASLFEARGELNDSFVDYRQYLKWKGPGFPYLPQPLLRLASEMHDDQEFLDYKRMFPGASYKLKKNEGEVILLLEQGKAPFKIPNPQFRLLPKFHKTHYESDYVWLSDVRSPLARARTYPLFDIEATAIKQLDDRIAIIVAKKVGGYILKEVIAAEVAKQTNSEAAGLLTSILLHAADHADLRSWTTLPAKLQLARMALPAGRHDLALDMVTQFGTELKGIKVWNNVDIKPGKTVYLNYRVQD